MGYIAYRAQQLEDTHSFQAQNLAVDYARKLASEAQNLSPAFSDLNTRNEKSEEEKKIEKLYIFRN